MKTMEAVSTHWGELKIERAEPEEEEFPTAVEIIRSAAGFSED
jgi:hypothetical protein